MADTAPDTAALRLMHDIWREVSRHVEIGESVPLLFAPIAAALRPRWMLVRRWDGERGRLDTVGLAGELPAASDLPARTLLAGPRAAELLSWAAHGEASAWASREQSPLARSLVPEALGGPCAAGPLRVGDTLEGVLVLGGELRGQLPALRALLEPLAVAMANDHRIHELSRLREAAEADRRALLARLDRTDISASIIGAEGGLREVMERVEQVSRTDAPVLILGETGSGKEVVARAIHTRSARAQGPFLRVNCGAIPPELVDSELFGHEKGAFTGAINTRKGWFERADGGTLFLDELGELPAAAQVRLLRVLQDGTFQRVGGQVSLSVDVRIVAATHRDMPTLVREGRFRQDLWYRISVFPIPLPPLRERRDDIAPLARVFAERAGLRLHGIALHPTDEDIALLIRYRWPGNVRELAAVIERAAILGNGHHLALRAALGVFAEAASPAPASERAHVEDVLNRCRGRIEGPFGAAAALGVNPHTLRSRMRRLGIDWTRYRR